MSEGLIRACSSCGKKNRVLYSRGFASIYGEWETTAEAQKMNRTYSESLRFPAVDRPARVVRPPYKRALAPARKMKIGAQ